MRSWAGAGCILDSYPGTVSGCMGFLSRSWKVLGLSGAILVSIGAQDVSNPRALVQPDQVARQVRESSPDRPLILFVGFPVMYRGAHIPDALLAGPASTPDGLVKLKSVASNLPRNRKLIIYCGCCPFVKCPNVKPAYNILREMGFSQIQILELDQNFHTDWVMRGYPVKRST